MTIPESFKAVNEKMSRPLTIIYADLNEANFDVDKLLKTELPVLIIIPFDVVDKRGKSGILNSYFDLDAMFLDKSKSLTTDYVAADVEVEVISPMRILAREFIFGLLNSPIIDPETDGISEATHSPVYSSMDANLFGVWTKARVFVCEGITGCNH